MVLGFSVQLGGCLTHFFPLGSVLDRSACGQFDNELGFTLQLF